LPRCLTGIIIKKKNKPAKPFER